MKFQSGPGMCGPAAIVNAARALGMKLKEEQIAQYAGTTVKDGTTEHGLKQALERVGLGFVDLNEKKYSVAEYALYSHLRNNPAIILAEAGDHWVAGIGTIGQSIIVFDSQNTAVNKRENGTHVIAIGDQLRRYWLPYQAKRYALLVHKP